VHRHAAEGRGFLAGAALVGLLAMVQQHSTVAAQTAAEVRLEAVAGAMAEYARELHDLGINDGEQIDALHRLTAQLDGTLDPLAADDATGDGWIAARTELALRPASND
jgi:type VI protein secretion system component VasF